MLPFAGYMMFCAESIFAPPNPLWVALLLLWALCATILVGMLIRRNNTEILDVLDRKASSIVIGLIAIASVIFVAINFLQAHYFTMGMRSRDMAYYNQILWNTLHGNILAGNLNQEILLNPPASNDFALHVSPFLLVGILPIYAIFPHFSTLLVIRDLALAAAAWPLFLLVRERMGGVAGIAAVVLYLANPTVMAQSYQEFTPLQLAPLPFFLAFRAFLREELGRFLCWMAIAISMREDVAVTMAGFGVWALVRRRSHRWTVVSLGIPLIWWGVATLLIQPAFGRWGNNISEIALAGGSQAQWGIHEILLRNPLQVLQVLGEGGLHYLYRMLRSVAFLAVMGWEGLLAVPVLIANLFYGKMSHEGIEATSRLALLPSCALIGATIVLINQAARKYQRDARIFAIVMLFFLPSANLLDGMKDTAQEGLITYTLHNDAEALWEVVGLIPDSASVAAPGYALPALANRSRLFNLPQLHMYPNTRLDYILLDRDLDRVTSNPELQGAYRALLEKLSHSMEYETVWKRGEYSLLRRREENQLPEKMHSFLPNGSHLSATSR